MNDIPVLATLRVVPISARAEDRWRLSDPYNEQVWSEFLGPSATLLGHRFGRMVEEHSGGIDDDLGDLAAGMGVQPNITMKPIKRLHRSDVVCFVTERSIVGVSGVPRCEAVLPASSARPAVSPPPNRRVAPVRGLAL